MKFLIFGFFLIGVYGQVNTLPAPPTPSPNFQTAAASSTTEKPSDISSVQTTPAAGSSTNKNSEQTKGTTLKPANEEHPGKVLGVTTVPNNIPTTGKGSKDEVKEPTTVTPSIQKANPTAVTTGEHKGEVTTAKNEQPTSPQEQKAGTATPPPNQKVPATTKPEEANKQAPSSGKKPTKSSPSFIDEGKIVIFNGICGPEGCEIEGDIYDELVPVTKTKKQG